MPDNNQDKIPENQQKEADKLPDSEEIKLEKLRLKYNFWKFVLGSVVVVVISLVLNHQIKTRELEITQRQNDQNFLTEFIDRGLDDNLEKRIRFAQYFASLTLSKEQRDLWDEYYKDLKTEEAVIETVAAEARGTKEMVEAVLVKVTGTAKQTEIAATIQVAQSTVDSADSELNKATATPLPPTTTPHPTNTMLPTATPTATEG